MADRLDVAGRLAEGRSAVERTQRYVLACQIVGYEHPDLTSHPAQICDWYDSEDGLDLHALDSDCAKLRSAAGMVADALRTQRGQVAELAAAWTGSGADAAIRFLQRHCDAANAVATEVRAAAQWCESLRDNLWHQLDAKVATVIAIDDRTLVQRPTWLATVDVITTGVGDRSVADELVRQQIEPYVDNDIRNDWLTAVRSTLAGMTASYDTAIDLLASASRADFEIPGDLFPGHPPCPPAPPMATTAAVAPAAALPAVTRDLPPVPPFLPPLKPVPPMAAAPSTPSDRAALLDDATVMPTGTGGTGGLGDLGGLSGLGGANGSDGLGWLGALASQIVEAMSNLLGSAAEQLTDGLVPDDLLGTEELGTEDPFEADSPNNDTDDVEEKPDAGLEKAEEVEEAEESPPVAASSVEGPPVAASPPAEPASEAPPVNTPLPDPPPGGSTPCEIAADELPQAGP